MKTIKTTQVDLLFRLVAWNSHRLVALDPHRISFALAKKWVIFSGNGSHLELFCENSKRECLKIGRFWTRRWWGSTHVLKDDWNILQITTIRWIFCCRVNPPQNLFRDGSHLPQRNPQNKYASLPQLCYSLRPGKNTFPIPAISKMSKLKLILLVVAIAHCVAAVGKSISSIS